MVLYFSATGNTEYIAKKIAEDLEDECLNLTERIKKKDYSPIHSEKPFTICSPVYVSVMPKFLMEHLSRQNFSGSRKIYFVFTAAGHMGISGMLGVAFAKKRKLHYMGCAEIAMPNNYVASNLFAATGPTDIKAGIQKAGEKAVRIAGRIKEGKYLSSGKVSFFEWFGTIAFVPVWFRFMQPSKPFYADDRCIGCGKCVKVCPLNNIRMQCEKPVWSGRQCSHCMACIGNCPVEAIEYGKVTQNKEKYHIKKHM